MELIDTYITQIADDLKFDDMNCKDMQMRLPGRKHYWVSRLITHKRDLEHLKKKKDSIYSELTKRLIEESPVALSRNDILAKISNLDQVKNINSQIRELELVIELLEKTEKTFSETIYSIKNVVELMKLEQL